VLEIDLLTHFFDADDIIMCTMATMPFSIATNNYPFKLFEIYFPCINPIISLLPSNYEHPIKHAVFWNYTNTTAFLWNSSL